MLEGGPVLRESCPRSGRTPEPEELEGGPVLEGGWESCPRPRSGRTPELEGRALLRESCLGPRLMGVLEE